MCLKLEKLKQNPLIKRTCKFLLSSQNQLTSREGNCFPRPVYTYSLLGKVLFSLCCTQNKSEFKIKLTRPPYSMESDLLLATFCPLKNTVMEAERGEWWDRAPACAWLLCDRNIATLPSHSVLFQKHRRGPLCLHMHQGILKVATFLKT
jgi:hypothetical protein